MLPFGWTAKIDLLSGKTYYQNDALRTTQWDHPEVNVREDRSVFGHYFVTQVIPIERRIVLQALTRFQTFNSQVFISYVFFFYVSLE